MRPKLSVPLIVIGLFFLLGGVFLSVEESGGLQSVLSSLMHTVSADDSISPVPPVTEPFSSAVSEPTLTPIVISQSNSLQRVQRQMFFSTNCNVNSPEISVYVSTSGTSGYSHNDGGDTTTFYPENMLDCRRDTAWRTEYRGREESANFTFSRPVRLSHIGFVPGYDKFDPYTNRDRWYQNRRISQVRVTVFMTDGTVCELYWSSGSDERTMQYIDTAACVQTVETAAVRLTILNSSPPLTNDPRDFVVISDVDFQGTIYE